MANQNTYSYTFQQSQLINEKIQSMLKELPSFCADYLYAKSASGKFQPRTRLAYLQELLLFFKYLCTAHEDFMNYEPNQITASMVNTLVAGDIRAYLAYVESYENSSGFYQNAEAGKARKLAAIRSLFKYLVSEHLIDSNIASLVETPTIKHDDIVYMSAEQQELFLENVFNGKHITNGTEHRAVYDSDSIVHLRDVAIISLFLGTGIRISELVALDQADVDFVDRSIYVYRKGGKSQKIYFSEDVEDALLSYLDYSRAVWMADNEDEPALFVSQRRKRIGVRAVQKMLEKYTTYTFGKGSGPKISVHKLRSTYATNLLEESDGNVYLVSNILGHSDLSTVQRYAKVQNQKEGALSLRRKKDAKE